MIRKKATFNSIDEYIGTFPETVQNIMEQLRTTIKDAVPDAGEKISYNMPTFTLNGTYLVYFAGWKKTYRFLRCSAGKSGIQGGSVRL